jgi:hypothetical protein
MSKTQKSTKVLSFIKIAFNETAVDYNILEISCQSQRHRLLLHTFRKLPTGKTPMDQQP